MKKINRLKRNEDFDKIIKEGKKRLNNHFIVYYLPSLSSYSDEYRVGISVGKKFGNAVTRNHQKRIVRTIITNCNLNIVKYDYVVISRPVCLKSTYVKQEEKLLQLLKEIK